MKQRFGPLFAKKFQVMVDERAGIAEILEHCGARGIIEWDAMNRSRAGGVVTGCRIEGTSMILHAKPGRFPVSYGTAADDIGGQAEREAKTLGIKFLDTNGRKGRIGAFGTVLWGNRGIEAAGLYG